MALDPHTLRSSPQYQGLNGVVQWIRDYFAPGAGLTASRALATNSSGQIITSDVTATELGRLSGVTSSIQTQLNAKGIQSIFRVDKNGTGQNYTTSSAFLVTWAANNLVDTASGFDDTGDYYEAQADGWHHVYAQLLFGSNADGDRCNALVYVDTGSGFALVSGGRQVPGAAQSPTAPVSVWLDLNDGDKVAVYAQNNDVAGTDNIAGGVERTYFEVVNFGAVT